MTTLEKLATWYQVSSIQYLGPVRFKKLWEILGDRIGDVFSMSETDLKQLKGIITPQTLEGIEKNRGKVLECRKFAVKQIDLARKHKGDILLLDDENYPKFLKESKMCHPILFCKGDIRKFQKYHRSVGIVGSRKASPHSLDLAYETARALAMNGWVVVAGMAKGIDTKAHLGALDGKGMTIGVLGCGVDNVYPPDNKELFARITINNLIVSEFPFGSRPEAWKLQKRNKTIVAMTQGIFVVQSTVKGGAMNAVRACSEQKKPVFTLIGDGTTEFSGNARILENGGIFLQENNTAQMIEDFLLNMPSLRVPSQRGSKP
jgi:DNA processing protein